MSFVRVMAVAAMTLGSASVVQAQALPSAADVVAKYVTAIGGRENVLKIKSITQIASMEVPAAGLTAELKAVQAEPTMVSQLTTLAGIGEMSQGFNGTVGWEINPMQGPRLYTPKEVEQAKEMNDLHGSRLFPADQYSKMEVLEQVDFNGEKAYKVKMVRKSGKEATHYFSTTTNLLIGSDITSESPMGSQTQQFKFSKYEAVEGVKFPMRTEMMVGPTAVIISVKSTTLNDVPASAFEVPAAIKPLISK